LIAKHHRHAGLGDIAWIKESDFRQDFFRILSGFTENYCLGFVDDSVMIRAPRLDVLIPQYTDDVVCISTRMNKHIHYCHPAKLEIGTPKNFIEETKFLKWDWTKENPNGEWGYPHAVDSHIYKTAYFKRLVYSIEYTFPNDLEGEMNHRRDPSRPNMVSDLESCVITIPNNLTQRGFTPHGENPEFSLSTLNAKFLEGYIIDDSKLYDFPNETVHQEIPYTLVRE
jgi:hypothetical protein